MRAIVSGMAVIALALSGFAQGPAKDAELKPLPELKLKDFDGKAVDYGRYKGNILMVDFWATWCGPCIKEIPTFNRLEAQFGGQGVKVLGVTIMSGEAAEVKPFVAKHSMKYAVLMGEDDQAHDLNIMGFPTTFLITRDGKIYKKYFGAGPLKAQQMEQDIRRLLDAEANRVVTSDK